MYIQSLYKLIYNARRHYDPTLVWIMIKISFKQTYKHELNYKYIQSHFPLHMRIGYIM